MHDNHSSEFYPAICLFGATYRAEPSVTSRHMTEFITVDAEMGFIRSFGESLELISELINEVCTVVWERREKELLALGAVQPVLTSKFREVPLQELHELCLKHTGEDFRGERIRLRSKSDGSAATRWSIGNRRRYSLRSFRRVK